MKYRAINLNTPYISIQLDHKFIFSALRTNSRERRLNMFYEHGAWPRILSPRESMCWLPTVIVENFLLLPKQNDKIEHRARIKFARVVIWR